MSILEVEKACLHSFLKISISPVSESVTYFKNKKVNNIRNPIKEI